MVELHTGVSEAIHVGPGRSQGRFPSLRSFSLTKQKAPSGVLFWLVFTVFLYLISDSVKPALAFFVLYKV